MNRWISQTYWPTDSSVESEDHTAENCADMMLGSPGRIEGEAFAFSGRAASGPEPSPQQQESSTVPPKAWKESKQASSWTPEKPSSEIHDHPSIGTGDGC